MTAIASMRIWSRLTMRAKSQPMSHHHGNLGYGDLPNAARQGVAAAAAFIAVITVIFTWLLPHL
jgi:hypothetical protein